ncbi:MAG: asparaginase [Candidatus Omnitrophica bacterium]|nr:asparaginase [Candidatus Omnitrophota bacterium]MBU0881030.1 asparaginase [Candidatus Omnitrophota bacterium]MBU1037856.1 asparaginase [Candidatus Omnitrophota bacterium]MBU1807952.1 asparaginase [Candidatus Omnitrophota bacterium]
MKAMKYSGFLVCCIVLCVFFVASSYAEMPTVVIVTTGGTIAEKTDPETGGAVPAVSGKDLIEAVPGLGKIANIEVVNLCNIDSSQMTPEIWAKLSKTVDGRLAEAKVKGAVVTHGTDTMAEGAYFLGLTLKSDKPVAFVGAMRDASDVSPDGPANILNAVTQVCSKEAQDWGVTVTLNEYVNSARNVVKTNSTNVQTFDSGEKGYLGYIAMGKVIHYNDAPARQRLPIPDKLPNVTLLSTFAGDDGSLVRFAADHGARGIVMDAVGAGNVNAEVYEAIKYAMAKGIPVVITTRVYHSGVWPMYGDQGGGETLEKNGAILGGDLTGAKARLLLMLAIAKEKDDVSKIKVYFKR